MHKTNRDPKTPERRRSRDRQEHNRRLAGRKRVG